VPPALLESRLPAGLELDTRDGQAFVSLVGFDFLDTRVFGIPWPGYRNFAELNLRFYVRQGDERGVVFLREFVPQRLVAFLARTFYNEPYFAAPLVSALHEEADGLTIEHRLTWAGRTHTIAVTGTFPAQQPAAASMEHFFKEHRWGYGVSRRGECIRYEVHHPLWEVYPVRSYRVDLDWAKVYGPEWQCLDGQAPCSVVFALGSAIAVYPKAKAIPVSDGPARVKLMPGTPCNVVPSC